MVILATTILLAGCNLGRGVAALSGSSPTLTTSPLSQAPASATPNRAAPVVAVTQIAPTAPVAEPGTPPACTNRAAFVGDVTIRDGTEVAASSAFAKVWRLRNEGSCHWTPAYQLVFVGGAAMGGPRVIPLEIPAMPGETLDLEVDLTAPDLPGIYQGFWKLRSPGGEYFGVGAAGDLAFWVQVVVPAPPSSTGVPTPSVEASGTVTLKAETGLDLDQGIVDPAAGGDVAFDTSAQPRRLRPLPGTLLGRYASRQPPASPADCQAVALSDAPFPFLGPASGTMICYRTSEGRLGFLTIDTLNGELGLTYITWAK